MAALVSGLSTAPLQCEKLIAQIDEGRIAALAPKFEIEQATIESQSIIDITDFERDVVETNDARFSCFSHVALHQLLIGRESTKRSVRHYFILDLRLQRASQAPRRQVGARRPRAWT